MYKKQTPNPTRKRTVAINRADGSIIAIWDSLTAVARDCDEPINNIHQKLGKVWWDAAFVLSYLDHKGAMEEYSVIEKELVDAVRALELTDDDVMVFDRESYEEFISAKPFNRSQNLDHLADEPQAICEVTEPHKCEGIHLHDEPEIEASTPVGTEIKMTLKDKLIHRRLLVEELAKLAEELEVVDKEIETEKAEWIAIGESAGWI